MKVPVLNNKKAPGIIAEDLSGTQSLRHGIAKCCCPLGNGIQSGISFKSRGNPPAGAQRFCMLYPFFGGLDASKQTWFKYYILRFYKFEQVPFFFRSVNSNQLFIQGNRNRGIGAECSHLFFVAGPDRLLDAMYLKLCQFFQNSFSLSRSECSICINTQLYGFRTKALAQ